MSTSAERILILMSMLDDLKKMKDELKDKKEEPKEEEKQAEEEASFGYHMMPFESALAVLKSSWLDMGTASQVLGITCDQWAEDEILYIDGDPECETLHRGYTAADEVYPAESDEDDAFYVSSDDIIHGKWRVVYRP